MVERIFLLPQVKRSVIISNKLVYTNCLNDRVGHNGHWNTMWSHPLLRPSEFIKWKNQSKTWTDPMLRYLNQYRKTKQRASIHKTHVGNTNRAHTEPSQALGQIPQAMKYLRQKPLQKYTTSLYSVTPNPKV